MLLCRIAARTTPAAVWTLPGGGLEFGEDPAEGVLRELRRGDGLPGTVDGLLGDPVGDLEPEATSSAATGSTRSASSTA